MPPAGGGVSPALTGAWICSTAALQTPRGLSGSRQRLPHGRGLRALPPLSGIGAAPLPLAPALGCTEGGKKDNGVKKPPGTVTVQERLFVSVPGSPCLRGGGLPLGGPGTGGLFALGGGSCPWGSCPSPPSLGPHHFCFPQQQITVQKGHVLPPNPIISRSWGRGQGGAWLVGGAKGVASPLGKARIGALVPWVEGRYNLDPQPKPYDPSFPGGGSQSRGVPVPGWGRSGSPSLRRVGVTVSPGRWLPGLAFRGGGQAPSPPPLLPGARGLAWQLRIAKG